MLQPLRKPSQAGHGGADAAPPAREAEHLMAGARAWARSERLERAV